MKCVKHILYVKVALKRIELARKIFLFDVQLGKSIYVPKELQIDSCSLGFRYYDPIFNTLQEGLPNDFKQVLNFRRSCRMKVL